MRHSGTLALLCVALLAAAPGAHAQPVKRPKVGVLVPLLTPSIDVFRAALKERGYTEGANVTLDVRVAGERLDQLAAMAGEMVKGSPDVILAVNTPGTQAAMAATSTIPIVMVAVGDPIGLGFVSSFARTDRNVTGLTNLCGELAGKRLALFKEALPRLQRVAVMLNPGDAITKPQVGDLEKAAPTLGIEARFFPVRSKAEVESSIDAMVKWRADGILWLCGQQRRRTEDTIPLAARHRIPVMVMLSIEVPPGALMSYATDNDELYRRAAIYVDRLLKGAKIADLPVELPTKFELTINMKTAASLGLAFPQSILLRADRIIK